MHRVEVKKCPQLAGLLGYAADVLRADRAHGGPCLQGLSTLGGAGAVKYFRGSRAEESMQSSSTSKTPGLADPITTSPVSGSGTADQPTAAGDHTSRARRVSSAFTVDRDDVAPAFSPAAFGM